MEQSASDAPSNLHQHYADGWYLQSGDQQIGPMNLQDLSQRYRAGHIALTDHAWHERAGRWLPMSELARFVSAETTPDGPKIDPSVMRRLLRRHLDIVRNAIFLSVTSIAALVFVLIFFAAVTGNDSGYLVLLIFLTGGFLTWWAWLEYQGISLNGTHLDYPARLGYWPQFIPYKMAFIELGAIQSAAYSSNGRFTHYVILNTNDTPIKLLFDSAVIRDMFLAMLSLREVKITDPSLHQVR